MADEKLTNRWLMVVAALVMQLCLGVLYSYSVFRGPLMKEVGFTVKQAGYPLHGVAVLLRGGDDRRR